jgi:hypothetical protein
VNSDEKQAVNRLAWEPFPIALSNKRDRPALEIQQTVAI